MGGTCCTADGANRSTGISVSAGWSGWATARFRLDRCARCRYTFVRPAVSSDPPNALATMRSLTIRLLAASVLTAAVIRPARAEGRRLADDTPPAIPVCEPIGDADQNGRWWMPSNACCHKKSPIPYGFVNYQSECDATPPPAPPRSLIEEAESLLETPRFDSTRSIIPSSDEKNAFRPSGDQFSRAWSDGAPLLLFDWSGKSVDPLAAPSLRQDGVQRVASSNAASDFGDLSAKVKLRDRDSQLDPSGRSAWETDQTVKVPVAGSVFFFNQVSGSTPDVDQQQYKWLGKSGVGLKLKPWLFQEVQVRTGPVCALRRHRHVDQGPIAGAFGAIRRSSHKGAGPGRWPGQCRVHELRRAGRDFGRPQCDQSGFQGRAADRRRPVPRWCEIPVGSGVRDAVVGSDGSLYGGAE